MFEQILRWSRTRFAHKAARRQLRHALLAVEALEERCAPAISITAAATLPSATVGAAYSEALSASGGIAPYSWSVSPSLPAGLKIDFASGTISGMPTAGGVFSFTVTATDSTLATGSQPYSLTVNAPTISISPTTLTSPAVGISYSQTLTASGGTAPYSWTVSSGALPTGLQLSAGGTINGKPTATGSFTFTISAKDASTGTGPYSASQSYTVSVLLGITPATLPGGTVGVAYKQTTLTASGGTAPYSWSVSSGTLPAGLTLAPTTGTITGTPTAAGSFTFTVQATDSSATPLTGSQQYSLTVAALSLSPTTLPGPVVGVAYSQALTASGGTAPYHFKVSSGALPAGLKLSDAGTISGTATAAGPFTFTVQATDSANPADTGSEQYSFTVALGLSPTTLTTALEGDPYTQALSASGGTAPYHFKVSSGALPAGLKLSDAGTISGTATAAGPFTFTVQATDSASPAHTGSQTYTLTVKPLRVQLAIALSHVAPNSPFPAFQATVLDALGKPLQGVRVTLRLVTLGAIGPAGFGSGSVLSAVTGANGKATFTDVSITTRGVYQIEADADSEKALSQFLQVGLNGRHSPA